MEQSSDKFKSIHKELVDYAYSLQDIGPNEPSDYVQEALLRMFKKYGRERLLEIIEEEKGRLFVAVANVFRNECRAAKVREKYKRNRQKDFDRKTIRRKSLRLYGSESQIKDFIQDVFPGIDNEGYQLILLIILGYELGEISELLNLSRYMINKKLIAIRRYYYEILDTK